MGQTKKVVNRKTVYLDPIALESRRNVVRPLPYHVVSSDIPPRLVDYSDFANGKALGTKFPFAGFPVLAQELCDWLSIQPLEAITIKKIRSMFYKLFCYFTELELNNKTSFSILSRAHFTQFPKWCEKRMEKKVGATHQNLKYIYELRKHFGVSEEFYGTVRTPTTNPVAIPTDIRKEIVKSVRSSAAKVVSKWLSINRVFEKGIDDDPIIQNYKTSADRRTWDDEKYIQMAEAARGEKIATPVNWLAKPELMPTSTYFTRGDVLLCMKYFCENYNDFPSPQNLKNELAQLAKLNARSFDIAKFPLVRLGEYFYGDSEDIGILATEILIQTGWNWQTLRELDPFDYRLNPTSSNQRVKIYSKKKRTGEKQFANEPIQYDYDSAQVQNDPVNLKKCYSPQLLEMIIAKTKPLRDWCARASSDSRLVEGYKLPADFNKFPNSTWLVYSAAKTGSKNSKGGRKELPFKAAFDFNEFGRQADKSELIFRITGIRGITTRTFRKMVAQFNQDKFGLKSASLHAGHSNETVTNDHYVGTEERKANINTTLRVLTSSLVENLAGRRLDFSEIFLNTEYIHEPSVASKAIKNLKLIRENMGCSNPQKPSMNVSNNGLSGASECPFDRCVMCNNAYLFSDSYIFLARRLAELDHLIVRLPNIALTVKEFQAERLNLELILSEGYEATNWKEIHKSWFERFAAGEFISSY